MLRLLRTISVQAWYYCNIYRMADGKATETTSSLTPVRNAAEWLICQQKLLLLLLLLLLLIS